MKYFFWGLLILPFFSSSSIYSFTVNGIDGTQINFNNFQHKKILLVNIATNSSRVNQIGELKQLQQQYEDSLVIIGFPSNSFGNESRSNAAIKQFCDSAYSINFLLAGKGSVKGSDQQLVFYWLTHTSENNTLDSEIKGDFQKYLIDRDGELIGVFVGSVSPLSPQIINNITATAAGTQN